MILSPTTVYRVKMNANPLLFEQALYSIFKGQSVYYSTWGGWGVIPKKKIYLNRGFKLRKLKGTVKEKTTYSYFQKHF